MTSDKLSNVFPEDEESDVKTKKSKKSAKAVDSKKARKGEERSPQGSRGIGGINLFQLLRETFSSEKGVTIPQAVAVLLKATEGQKGRGGSKYPEKLIVGRIRKFLAGARINGHLKTKGEAGNGETKYQYTGELTLERGKPGKAKKDLAKPKTKPKLALVKTKPKKAKVKVKAEEEESEEEIEDEDNSDGDDSEAAASE